MFRQGPLPVFLHGIVEYLAGGLFIALPLLLGYNHGAATAASIVIGVLMIGIAASTDWGLSLNHQIPKPAHFALDWVIAGVLIASPFLFGFSKESTPTAIFIAAGVLQILMTIGTRFGKKEPKPEAEPASDLDQGASDLPPVSASDLPPATGSAATTGDRSSARRS
jgi:hypothetical protein